MYVYLCVHRCVATQEIACNSCMIRATPFEIEVETSQGTRSRTRSMYTPAYIIHTSKDADAEYRTGVVFQAESKQACDLGPRDFEVASVEGWKRLDDSHPDLYAKAVAYFSERGLEVPNGVVADD